VLGAALFEGEQFQVCHQLRGTWVPRALVSTIRFFMCPCHGGATIATVPRFARRNLCSSIPYKVQTVLVAISKLAIIADSGIPNRLSFRNKAPCGARKRLVSIESKLSASSETNALLRKTRHGRDRTNRAMLTSACKLAAPIRDAAEHPVPRKHGELVYVFGSARSPSSFFNSLLDLAGPDLCSFGKRGLEQSASAEPRCNFGLVHPRHARVGLEFHGGDRPYPHGAGLPLRSVQISARAHLDRRRLSFANDARHGFQRPSVAF